jgi:hypothetical protein
MVLLHPEPKDPPYHQPFSEGESELTLHALSFELSSQPKDPRVNAYNFSMAMIKPACTNKSPTSHLISSALS